MATAQAHAHRTLDADRKTVERTTPDTGAIETTSHNTNGVRTLSGIDRH